MEGTKNLKYLVLGLLFFGFFLLVYRNDKKEVSDHLVVVDGINLELDFDVFHYTDSFVATLTNHTTEYLEKINFFEIEFFNGNYWELVNRGFEFADHLESIAPGEIRNVYVDLSMFAIKEPGLYRLRNNVGRAPDHGVAIEFNVK